MNVEVFVTFLIYTFKGYGMTPFELWSCQFVPSHTPMEVKVINFNIHFQWKYECFEIFRIFLPQM